VTSLSLLLPPFTGVKIVQSVQGRESVLSVQGRRGRLAKRKRREGERESNMARERENEREQVSKREKMTVGLFTTPVSVSRTAVSDSPRSCGGGSSIIDPYQ